MTTAIAVKAPQPDAEIVQRVLMEGDLSKLTPAQKVGYYNNVCESLGLNPLTKPFAYLKLNGKEVLYALRDAAEQLRKLHGVSITDIQTQHVGDCYMVIVKAQDKTGRTDASTGVVPISNLKGENLANGLMKAETKAKRRVTLSICGLGMLDESELDTIPAAQTSVTIQPDPPATVVDASTGEDVPAAARPAPPDGFVYLDEYWAERGWHHVKVNGDEFKTKKVSVGDVACQAFQNGVPVKLDTNGVWLNNVTTWKPSQDVPDCRACGLPVDACECRSAL